MSTQNLGTIRGHADHLRVFFRTKKKNDMPFSKRRHIIWSITRRLLHRKSWVSISCHLFKFYPATIYLLLAKNFSNSAIWVPLGSYNLMSSWYSFGFFVLTTCIDFLMIFLCFGSHSTHLDSTNSAMNSGTQILNAFLNSVHLVTGLFCS